MSHASTEIKRFTSNLPIDYSMGKKLFYLSIPSSNCHFTIFYELIKVQFSLLDWFQIQKSKIFPSAWSRYLLVQSNSSSIKMTTVQLYKNGFNTELVLSAISSTIPDTLYLNMLIAIKFYQIFLKLFTHSSFHIKLNVQEKIVET